MLLQDVTCYTISLLSCLYVNTVELLNVMCALVATSVMLWSLECICLCCQLYIHNIKYVNIYKKKLTHTLRSNMVEMPLNNCHQCIVFVNNIVYMQKKGVTLKHMHFVHMEITIPYLVLTCKLIVRRACWISVNSECV